MSELLLLALTLLGYALVSQRLSLSPLTAPMVSTDAMRIDLRALRRYVALLHACSVSGCR